MHFAWCIINEVLILYWNFRQWTVWIHRCYVFSDGTGLRQQEFGFTTNINIELYPCIHLNSKQKYFISLEWYNNKQWYCIHQYVPMESVLCFARMLVMPSIHTRNNPPNEWMNGNIRLAIESNYWCNCIALGDTAMQQPGWSSRWWETNMDLYWWDIETIRAPANTHTHTHQSTVYSRGKSGTRR